MTSSSTQTRRPTSTYTTRGTIGMASLCAALIATGNVISEVYRDPPLSSVDPTAPGAVSYLAHHIIVFLVAGIASFLLFRLWDSCTGKESPSALR